MQALLFLTALTAASAVDCRERTIPGFLCLLTAAAGLISFSPAQLFGVLAALPLLIAALIRPECMGGGDIKLTAAAGFVLGFWRGIWGMALKLLPGMNITFDLAFVDGDKRKYIEYYEMVLEKLSPGGYIIADNTLWDGHVLEEPHHTDLQTIGIKKFNDLVAADKRVEKVILPLRDGLTIIRKC